MNDIVYVIAGNQSFLKGNIVLGKTHPIAGETSIGAIFHRDRLMQGLQLIQLVMHMTGNK